MSEIIHATDIRTFLECRRKFFFGQIERLKPKNDETPEYFNYGTDGHSVLNAHYREKANILDGAKNANQILEEVQRTSLTKLYPLYKAQWEEEDSEFQYMTIENVFNVTFQGVEIHFTIDLMVLYQKMITVIDHKFYDRMANYGANLEWDFQASIYCWAARKIGFNVERFILNVIKKHPPQYPTWLKTKNRFSESQTSLDNTNYHLFLEAITEMGQTEEMYSETLKLLKNRDSAIFKRFPTRRTADELEKFEWKLATILEDIYNPRIPTGLEGDGRFASFYTSPDRDCPKCPFNFLCKVMDGAGDYEMTKSLSYNKKEEGER